jgi:hypothetical protein
MFSGKAPKDTSGRFHRKTANPLHQHMVQPYFPIINAPTTSKGLQSRFDPPDTNPLEVVQSVNVVPDLPETQNDGPRRSARVAAKYALTDSDYRFHNCVVSSSPAYALPRPDPFASLAISSSSSEPSLCSQRDPEYELPTHFARTLGMPKPGRIERVRGATHVIVMLPNFILFHFSTTAIT